MMIKLYKCEAFTIAVEQLREDIFQVVETVEGEIRVDARYVTFEQAMFKAADLLFEWNKAFIERSND